VLLIPCFVLWIWQSKDSALLQDALNARSA
jgi:hypothetical protein